MNAGSSERLVVDTLTRYLALCDVPVRTEGELGDLFTEDAVWEGGGSEYTEKFGRTEGREAIVEMLSAYLPPAPHFLTNVHLLFPGVVYVKGITARGSWKMQQLSRYESGAAEVMVAKLDVTFRIGPDRPRISAFRTERLFSAPLTGE
ncbi:nuclear transport factor 2 family protein [Streptomyces prunicolor]|uniref:Nuclear transport factor 2 family protein n=1 Tax=Streptomyces prunicolor TaxID=67348 RepID=A0ABU4F239_9ACTN|nr:nuclear transport factor 2 family protein [Streptomyces prunicolor]MDV7214659.1 nuclear transport factor 2 family protein [Streptomyces prunicolor]